MHVTILLGGDSAERDISLQSGHSVANALESRGHQVTCIDPKDISFDSFSWPQCDVVFIALHGEFGEDGQIQKILDRAGLCYTGSHATASGFAFHKSQAKEIFEQQNIPTPASYLFDRNTPFEQIAEWAMQLNYPLFIKPEAQGSSIGISCVNDSDELLHAIKYCLKFDSSGLIQKAVIGTEWTVGIFDDTVFPLIQIRFQNRFYDHCAKYKDEATTFLLDEAVSPQIQQELISAAKKAYQAFGARGVARVDLILDQTDKAWVLELNTIPGMTDHSLIPKAAQKMGWSFPQLCENICLAAIK
ncbi:MAG: D-alanine--D-alanine ligase [Planctomycetaceae bacterium]|nr:D-alanine--D-alanine ligase [Planctomycetaceae bacterium]